MAKKKDKKKSESYTLADAIYDDHNGLVVTRDVAADLAATVVSTITYETKGQGRYQVFGLGVFKVRECKARTGRNPRTGEVIQIPARRVVGFKASRAFAESVR